MALPIHAYQTFIGVHGHEYNIRVEYTYTPELSELVFGNVAVEPYEPARVEIKTCKTNVGSGLENFPMSAALYEDLRHEIMEEWNDH